MMYRQNMKLISSLHKIRMVVFMRNYTEFKGEMSLSDHLSCERTKLALKRTFLAYVRTSIGLFVAGVGFVVLRNYPVLSIVGVILIVLAIVFLVFGAVYCRRFRKDLKDLQ